MSDILTSRILAKRESLSFALTKRHLIACFACLGVPESAKRLHKGINSSICSGKHSPREKRATKNQFFNTSESARTKITRITLSRIPKLPERNSSGLLLLSFSVKDNSV